jgi:hypothetical protein
MLTRKVKTMKPFLLLSLVLLPAPLLAQDKAPVEIVRVEPHSHALCALAGSDDPWGSCLLISYRNTSAQPITAIRFEATFIDAMKEADPSVYSYDDTRKVKPGKTQTALWGDGAYWHQYGDKMGANVRVTKVMFADGTFWGGGPSASEMAQQKLFAQATVDGMAALYPSARVNVTDAAVAFYDDHADNTMCNIVKSSRAVLQTVGATKITVSSKTGEVCKLDLTQ